MNNTSIQPLEPQDALNIAKNGSRFMLSIDDKTVILFSRQKILEAAGYNVSSVSNGEQALSFFSAVLVDLVLLDDSMPGLDGGQVATEMKVRRPRTPIILAHSIENEALPCVDWVFAKGEGPELLLEKILQLLPSPSAA